MTLYYFFVFDRTKKTIDIHETDNLRDTVFTCNVFPQQPRCLTSCPPSTLLFENSASFQVSCLDYKVDGSSPGTVLNIPHEDYFSSMFCVTESETNRKFLVTSHYYSGRVFAYNMETGAEEWSLPSDIPGATTTMQSCGITTDGNGHLFVCDINNSCIQMFDMNGGYIGVLLSGGEQGIGNPKWAGWCDDSHSLIVAHVKNEKWFISVVNVKATDKSY